MTGVSARWALVLVGFLTTLGVMAVGAARGDIDRNDPVRWLMNEPVTLMDWGIARMEADLDQAAERMTDAGYFTVRPMTGAMYNWRSRSILLYVSSEEVWTDRTDLRCRQLFGDVIDHLAVRLPQSNSRAAWYLESVFGHETFNGGRPSNFGERMLEIVRVEVTLRPDPGDERSGDKLRVRCQGRMDAAAEDLLVTVTGRES